MTKISDDHMAEARELMGELDLFCSYYLTEPGNYAKCEPRNEYFCHKMTASIATALSAAHARGVVEGLREAREICRSGRFREDAQSPGEAVVFHIRATIAAIDARLSALTQEPKS